MTTSTSAAELIGPKTYRPSLAHGYLPRKRLLHVLNAKRNVPLVLITLSRALQERFDRHRAIARWTYPLWLYVSVTGVAIYFMLYHLFRAA